MTKNSFAAEVTSNSGQLWSDLNESQSQAHTELCTQSFSLFIVSHL